MEPMAPWQRVWIDADIYAQDVHSYINCTACHQGQPIESEIELTALSVEEAEALMTEAHTNLSVTATEDPEATCGTCHRDIAPHAESSLHVNLAGYDAAIYARSAPEHYDTLETMEVSHCNACHASCSDCHVSLPQSVGGGLINAHVIESDVIEANNLTAMPSMSKNCTACHGSRVKNEYFGLNEGIPADAHFRSRMSCNDCHSGADLHGQTNPNAQDRYDGMEEPSCISCHENQVGVGSGIAQHEVHGTELLSCQTCHSTTYTNCVNCHVERTEEDIPYYIVEEHYLDFNIGLNPLRDADRPYKYVTLRHVPIDPDSFSYYGENLLPNYTAESTFVYSTPHNIQRNTPQNASCLSCHGNDTVFLTESDFTQIAEWMTEYNGRPLEENLQLMLEANKNVMIDKAPPLPEGYESYITETETPTPEAGPSDDFWGTGETSETPAPSAEDSFWGDAPAATPTPSNPDDFWGGGTAETPTPAPTSADDFWGQ